MAPTASSVREVSTRGSEWGCPQAIVRSGHPQTPPKHRHWQILHVKLDVTGIPSTLFFASAGVFTRVRDELPSSWACPRFRLALSSEAPAGPGPPISRVSRKIDGGAASCAIWIADADAIATQCASSSPFFFFFWSPTRFTSTKQAICLFLLPFLLLAAWLADGARTEL
jgi:hypothetical protein